jgi:hypothetical protein
MNALLTTIVLWLSTNFGLPASYDHPQVEFVPETKIVEIRYKGFARRLDGRHTGGPLDPRS